MRVLELIGLMGPVVALGLLVLWRRRIPAGAKAFAVTGAVFAAVASALAVVGERVICFGGSEGVMERFDTVSLWRWIVLAAAVGALSTANLVGRDAGSRPWGWLTGGWALAMLGVVAALLGGALTAALSEGPESGIATLAQIIGDSVQFAALGLGVVVLCVGVAVRRGGDSPDAGSQAMDLAGQAWRAYSSYRGSRR